MIPEFNAADLEAAISQRLPTVSQARKYSNEKLSRLRGALESKGLPSDWLIGTYGSYARREASSQSDLDFFAICTDETQTEACGTALREIDPSLTEIAGRSPSADGSFGQASALSSMLENIGGSKDSNESFTRRILFLLEGEWLHNPELAQRCRESLIACYVRDSITSHQMALFLLNDIIRYYRTICVDFEFKTFQAINKKPWGVRNVKLVFSRKLLYFSGVLAVAETAQCTYDRKIENLNALFSLPVIDRVMTVCGTAALRALTLYEEFLRELEKENVRAALNEVTEEKKNDSPVFRDLKDAGHHFSWELLTLLKHTYESSHPIHRALIL